MRLPVCRAVLLSLAVGSLASGCLPATRSSIVETGSDRAKVTARAVPPAKGSSSSVRREAAARNDAAIIEAYASDRSIPAPRRSILNQAGQWLGVPYRYGGESFDGTDCSGFVQTVFAAIGHRLPRTSRAQATVGSEVQLWNARPGDLVFFNTSGSGVSHVGILLSEEEFVHASTTNGVIVSRLDEAYYRQRFMFARRVID